MTETQQTQPYRHTASAAPSDPIGFEALLAQALANYTSQTGHDIQDHMTQFDGCRSVENMIGILETRSEDLASFRNKGKKIRAFFAPFVRLIELINDTCGEAAAAASVPGGKAVFTAFAILLTAAKGVTQAYDMLEDLSERIQDAISRIEIHLRANSPPSLALKSIFIQMLVQVLNILALFTRYLDGSVSKHRAVKILYKYVPRRILHYKKALMGDKDVEDALTKLEKLTTKEVLTEAAEIHVIVKDILDIHMDDKITKWLSPPDIFKSHEARYKSQLKGTGKWLFSSNSKFSQWKQAKKGIFWIHGKPGSGKSVLCSSAIETLMEEPGLAYFYFDFQDPTKQTLYGLLSCLVYQLASRSLDCNQLLTELYGKHHRARPQPHPNNDLLVDCLKSMLQVLSNVYLVLDALDECPEATRHKDLLPLLEKIIGYKKEGFHLLVTSRPEQDIKKTLLSNVTYNSDLARLQEVSHYMLDLNKTIDHTIDLHNYISKEISMVDSWSTVVQASVQTSLTSKADGMFLLASLQLQTLRRCLPVAVQEVLRTLPSSLNDIYKHILESIDIVNRPFAFHILECLAYAFRPLSPQELAEVFIVDFGQSFTLKPAYRVQDAEESLSRICSSLIQVVSIHDEQLNPTRVVQFSHLSIRDYLVSSESIEAFHLEHFLAHTTLAILCVSNLISPSHSERLPLNAYAMDYWLKHMLQTNGCAMNILGEQIRHLLHPEARGHLTAWRHAHVDGVRYDENARAFYCAVTLGQLDIVQEWLSRFPEMVNVIGGPAGTGLCVAAMEGNIAILSLLLKAQAVVDAQGRDNLTPLHFAAKNGHVEIVQALLQMEAAVDAQEMGGWTPLHFAAQNGHVEVVQTILKSTATVNARNKYKLTPLHLAAQNGHVKVVQLLLKSNAAVDAQDMYNRTPLHLAAEDGNVEVVQTLLESKAAVDAQNKDKCTPLHIAAQNGHLEVIETLLESEAAVDSQDLNLLVDMNLLDYVEVGRTPLYYAALNGHVEVVRTLLKCKVGGDVLGKDRWTPVHAAAENGHVEVVQALLECKAAVDALQKNNLTPLHVAAYKGHVKVVQSLLGSKAAVDAQYIDNRTPLHLAAMNGRVEVVQTLLRSKAAVDAEDTDNCTPLHIAAKSGYVEVVQILLESKAAVDAQQKNNCTPLHLAAWNGHVKVVQVLLEGKAAVDAQDIDNCTPLHLAALNGHGDVVQTLLRNKATVDAQDMYRETSLHFAAQNDHADVVQTLLESKAAVDAQDEDNLTSLHLAARDGHVKVVQTLLKGKAAVDAQDKDSLTPLYHAALNGHVEVVHILLKWGAASPGNAQVKNGWTPLHAAAQNGHVDVVQSLLESKTDVDATQKDNLTPLHLAAQNGYVNVVQSLLNSNATVDAQDMYNWTPLHLAADNGHVAVVQTLLENKAAIDAQQKDSQTALHLAAQNGHAEVVQTILRHKAAVNPRDSGAASNSRSSG